MTYSTTGPIIYYREEMKMTKSQSRVVKFYADKYKAKGVMVEMIDRTVCLSIGSGAFSRIVFVGPKGTTREA